MAQQIVHLRVTKVGSKQKMEHFHFGETIGHFYFALTP
jgi:hypothetical protein